MKEGGRRVQESGREKEKNVGKRQEGEYDVSGEQEAGWRPQEEGQRTPRPFGRMGAGGARLTMHQAVANAKKVTKDIFRRRSGSESSSEARGSYLF